MLKGSAYVLLLKVVGEGLGLIMIIIAGNFYSVEDVGLLLFVQNNLFLFGTIGALGLGTCFHRFLPGYLEHEHYAEVRGLQRWVYGRATVGLIVASAFLAVFMLTLNETRIAVAPTILTSIAVISWGWVTLNRNYMRAMRLIFWSEVSYQIIRPLGGCLLLLVGVLFSGGSTLVVLALLLPLLFGSVHDIWRTKRLIKGQSCPADYTKRSDWAQSASHYALFNFSRVILQRLDLIVVTALLGFEVAAVYGLVSRLALLVSIAVDPIQSMFQPRASLHHNQGDTMALDRDIIQGSLWIAAASLTVAIVFLISTPVWLNIFGAVLSGKGSTALLFILLMGNIGLSNSSMASALLLMTGGEKVLGRLNSLLVIVIYPPVLLLATWAFGLYGAALATVLIRILIALGVVMLAKSHSGILALPWPSQKNLKVAFWPVLNYSKQFFR